MGELRDLIAIYGEIDRAVAADDGVRAAVAQRVSLYEDPDAHWYEAFAAWAEDVREDTSGGPAFPPLEEAVRDLESIPPRGRMHARRLWVLALAAQAFPELARRDDGSSPLARALGHGEVENESGRAQDLLELLADPDRLASAVAREDGSLDAWWDETLREAQARGLLIEADAEDLGPRPCTGRLVTVAVPGGSVEVAALETVFETSVLSFDQAVRFLHPETWPGCSALCCRMLDLGVQPSGLHRFRETVSADCADRLRTWTIQADLDFSFRQVDGQVAVAEYELSPGPQPDVLVDEGSLAVRAIGTADDPRIRVTTTKRVRFNRPFTGKQLAMIVCALGYASIVEDLIFTCAREGGPGKSLPAPGQGNPAVHPCVDLAARASRAAQASVEVWAQEVRAASAKAAARPYTADDLVQDTTRAWVRLLREGAAAFDPVTGDGPPPDPPPDPPPTRAPSAG
jgi:hypothetical protein